MLKNSRERSRTLLVVLSKAERKVLEAVRKGDFGEYTPVYKRQLKHNILKKRKTLTDDLLLVNEILEKLEEL
jgi:hypothetical protein